MAQAPTSSAQPTIAFTLDSTAAAETAIHLESAAADVGLTVLPAKSFQSVVFSSSDLVAGESYEVFFGGTATGDDVGGLYLSGEYQDGTEVGTITASG
jgi:hypothetical protein